MSWMRWCCWREYKIYKEASDLPFRLPHGKVKLVIMDLLGRCTDDRQG